MAGDTHSNPFDNLSEEDDDFDNGELENNDDAEQDAETPELLADSPSKFQALRNRMKESGSRFAAKFRGEHVEDNGPEPETKTDKAVHYSTVGAKIAVSAMATMTGVKGLVDVPAWFYQKYVTTEAEKNRLHESFRDVLYDSEIENDEALEIRQESLKKTIGDSKFLMPEKKAELNQKIQEIINTHRTNQESISLNRSKEAFALLDEYIQTRVKGTTALKEGVNSILKLSAILSGASAGLALGRSGTYLSVSLYERAKNVQNEIKEGKREGTFLKEYFNGFSETWGKLKGTEGKDWKEKSMNFAKAAGTIARASGFSMLALSAITGDNIPKDVLDGLLSAFASNTEDVTDVVESGVIDEAPESGAVALADQVTTTSEIEPEVADVPEAVTPTAEVSEPEADGVSEAPTEKFEEAIVSVPPDEINPIQESQLELATIKSGDGIIRIAQRQLEADPVKFGYQGDVDDASAVKKWVRKTAFVAAKKAGFVQSDGWTGISGKGIDKVAIVLSNEDGKLNFNFVDSHSGVALDADDLKEQNIIHDYVKPVESVEPTEKLPLIEKVYEAPVEVDEALIAPEPEAINLETPVSDPAEVPAQPNVVANVPEVSAEVVAAAEHGVPVDSKPLVEVVKAPVPDVSDSAAKHADKPDQTSDSRGRIAQQESPKSDVNENVKVIQERPVTVDESHRTTVEKIGKLNIERDHGHIPKIATDKESITFKFDGDKIYDYKISTSPLLPHERVTMLTRFGTTEDEFGKIFDNSQQDDMNKAFKEISSGEKLLEEMDKNGLRDTQEFRQLKRIVETAESSRKNMAPVFRKVLADNLAESAAENSRVEIGILADELSPIVETPNINDKARFAKLLTSHNVPQEQVKFLVRAWDTKMSSLAWVIAQSDADKAAIAGLDQSIDENVKIAAALQKRVDGFEKDFARLIHENATEEKAREGDALRNINDNIRKIEAGENIGLDVQTSNGHIDSAFTSRGGVKFSISENGRVTIDSVVEDGGFRPDKRPEILKELGNMTKAEFDGMAGKDDSYQHFQRPLQEFSAKEAALKAMEKKGFTNSDEHKVLKKSIDGLKKSLLGEIERYRQSITKK